MYFWNLKALKKDIIDDALSQKSLLLYILAYIVPIQLFAFSNLVYPPDQNLLLRDLEIHYGILNIFITLLGIYYCYYCNDRNLGKNLAEKFFSLSWVLGIRYIAFYIIVILLIMIIFGVTIYIFNIDEVLEELLLEIIVFISAEILIIIIYYRTGHHIKDINQKIKRKSATLNRSSLNQGV